MPAIPWLGVSPKPHPEPAGLRTPRWPVAGSASVAEIGSCPGARSRIADLRQLPAASVWLLEHRHDRPGSAARYAQVEEHMAEGPPPQGRPGLLAAGRFLDRVAGCLNDGREHSPDIRIVVHDQHRRVRPLAHERAAP